MASIIVLYEENIVKTGDRGEHAGSLGSMKKKLVVPMHVVIDHAADFVSGRRIFQCPPNVDGKTLKRNIYVTK